MPVIAVVNGKGGSGKSTVATHLAGWCARNDKAVMLGDVDRQQSTRTWLRQRDATLPAIATWATTQTSMLRAPNGVTHVVLDTPGGLHGFDLARVVMFADAIIMPVGNSIFDREAAAACHAELKTLPRVANGRCRLASIGMRIDARPEASQVLRDWAIQQRLPLLSVLRENSLYAQCAERGMTLFDLPEDMVTDDLAQWEPVLDWLMPVLDAAPRVSMPAPLTGTPAPRVASIVRPTNPPVAVRQVLTSNRPILPQGERKSPSPFVASRAAVATRPAPLEPEEQHIPAFLLQTS